METKQNIVRSKNCLFILFLTLLVCSIYIWVYLETDYYLLLLLFYYFNNYSVRYLKLCVLNWFWNVDVYMICYLGYVLWHWVVHLWDNINTELATSMLTKVSCYSSSPMFYIFFFTTIIVKALCHHHVTLTGPRQFPATTKGQKVIHSIHF